MTAIQSSHPKNARRWVFWGFLALAAFYLITEHRAHLAGSLRWLPVGLFLLCPLMHMFMHGGHGAHGRHGGPPQDSESSPDRGSSHESSDTHPGGH